VNVIRSNGFTPNSDGLNDVLETKLHTDAYNADTDGDGLNDSEDDLPQVSARLPASSSAPIVQDVLAKVAGFESVGIIESPRDSDDGHLPQMYQRVRSSSGPLDFLMLEGELLFSNNRRTIHARTPIAAGTASDRLMIRSWIRTTD